MNNDQNLMLAQMLNKQQVQRSTNERYIKELLHAESEHENENCES
jgi:hypothetical protein